MKRIVTLKIIVALLIIIMLLACDPDPDPDSKDDQPDAKQDDQNDDDDVSADDDQTDDDNDEDNDDDNNNDDGETTTERIGLSFPILGVEVEDGTTYRLSNPYIPNWTGDLWPSVWGADGKLYIANGDGFGFGPVFGDIVFNVVEGHPPNLSGSTPFGAWAYRIAGKWGPERYRLSRKPTGLTCVDGDIYLFFQNLANVLSEDPFGDAPHGSISMTPDAGQTWHWDDEGPMFTDHIFTTGFFLDYGKCQQHAIDDFVYVYGLDYNWRFADDFDQTKLFLARVHKSRIMDRTQWEFFIGLDDGRPSWSSNIEFKAPVIEDDTLYRNDKSGIGQGSVIFIPRLNRYLYSTRAVYEWIFYEAPEPWGPWTKITVREWTGGWTEEFHAGYPAVMPTKFLDADGKGGWIISSLSDSWFDGGYYTMCLRRFELVVGDASRH